MGSMEAIISSKVMRNSHAFVVNEIGLSIVKGEYPVGSTLPGDVDLTSNYGVSRTVIREAMKTLSAKGLIFARTRVGTKVTVKERWNFLDHDVLRWHFESGVDKIFIRHLCEMRLSFEPYAAQLASEHATQADIEQLFALADAIGDLDKSKEERAAKDVEFHIAVLNASKNPIMYSVGSVIEAALVGMFSLSTPDKKSVETSSLAHRAIVQAISDGNRESARQTMETVINAGQERLLQAK